MKDSDGILNNIKILEECNAEEREAIKKCFHPLSFEKGAIIFKQGEIGRTLYIVHKGTVSSATAAQDGNQIELAHYSEGRAFGEMAIVEACPRSTTCYALTDVELLALDIEDFYGLIWSQQEIGIKLLRSIMRYMILGLQEAEYFLTTMAMWGEKARLRAITDELTGLYNKRYLEESIELSIIKSKQQKTNFSLLVFDLDNFHEINTCLGLEKGDELIKLIAELSKECFCQNAIISRLGGDEFAVLFPDLPLEKALKMAVNFKISLESAKSPLLIENELPAHLKLTASIGIAEFPMHGETMAQIKQTADKALYAAKEAGRNTIICA
jgi:diguanylate cyclase (GGDEF)-like protein